MSYLEVVPSDFYSAGYGIIAADKYYFRILVLNLKEYF